MSNQPETLFAGRFLKLMRRGTWEYAERPNANAIAAVVAVTDAGEAVFVEQQRAPLQASTIEWPAGLIGDEDVDESIDEGANRELEEETGYRAHSFERLTRIPSSPGMTSETIWLMRANGLRRTGDGGGTEDEDIHVHLVPLEGVETWLRQREAEGKLIDPKVWAGLYFLVRRGTRAAEA
ncbi:MAG: NUDIX hydrolase [Bryobacterales bacterium]